MSVTYRVMHCTPEKFFEVLANGWSYPAWVVGASRARAVSEDWPAEGATLHHSFGMWPVVINDTTTIDEWSPPHRASLRARGGLLGVARVTFDVHQETGRIVVAMTEHPIKGPGVLVPPAVLDLVGQARNRETLRRLAYQAEQPRSGAEASD